MPPTDEPLELKRLVPHEERPLRQPKGRTKWVGASRSDFERQVAIDNPTFVALARRLVEDTLTRNERDMLARTVRVLELRDAGWNVTHIAEDLKINVQALSSFLSRGTFRIMARYVKERRANPNDKERVLREKSERARFEALGPKALDFLENCLDRDPVNPKEWKDRKEAKWATELIARGKGWDEPTEAGRRMIGELRVAVVVAQQGAIRQSDSMHHIVAVDVTPQPAELPPPEAPPEAAPMSPELIDDTLENEDEENPDDEVNPLVPPE